MSENEYSRECCEEKTCELWNVGCTNYNEPCGLIDGFIKEKLSKYELALKKLREMTSSIPPQLEPASQRACQNCELSLVRFNHLEQRATDTKNYLKTTVTCTDARVCHTSKYLNILTSTGVYGFTCNFWKRRIVGGNHNGTA